MTEKIIKSVLIILIIVALAIINTTIDFLFKIDLSSIPRHKRIIKGVTDGIRGAIIFAAIWVF